MEDLFAKTEANALRLLNTSGQDLVAGGLHSSPRAVGDAVPEFIAEEGGLRLCIPSEQLKSFESNFRK